MGDELELIKLRQIPKLKLRCLIAAKRRVKAEIQPCEWVKEFDVSYYITTSHITRFTADFIFRQI